MEVWYVMEDGSCGDPQECSPDADGVLRHKDGRAVAYRPTGPVARAVNPEDHRMKPESPKRYKTRVMKAK